MGMHWLGYDIGIVGKVGRKTSVVTVLVNYLTYQNKSNLTYVETNTPKYRVFGVHTRKPYSVTTLAT
jgi:hypothetical protein